MYRNLLNVIDIKQISTVYPFLRISVLKPKAQNIVIHPNDNKCAIPALNLQFNLLQYGYDLDIKSSIRNLYYLLLINGFLTSKYVVSLDDIHERSELWIRNGFLNSDRFSLN